jgi:hypothetical protein
MDGKKECMNSTVHLIKPVKIETFINDSLKSLE